MHPLNIVDNLNTIKNSQKTRQVEGCFYAATREISVKLNLEGREEDVNISTTQEVLTKELKHPFKMINEFINDLRKSNPSEEFKATLSRANLNKIMKDMVDNFDSAKNEVASYLFTGKNEEKALAHINNANIIDFADQKQMLSSRESRPLREEVLKKFGINWRFSSIKYTNDLIYKSHISNAEEYLQTLRKPELNNLREIRERKLRDLAKEEL